MNALCILLFAALFTTTVTAAAVDVCPAEFIRPCECVLDSNWMKVQCSNFSELDALQLVFDNSADRPFNGFILRDSSVMHMNATWLATKKIRQITLRNTSLTGLFDRVPDPNDLVTIVTLYDVRLLRGIQWEQFQPLTALRDIVLEGVEIRKFSKSFNDNVALKLRKLSLKDSKTNHLDDNVFQRFQEMETFVLQNAEVEIVKRSMFHSMIWLITFDMVNNHIASLPDDMFTNMPRLRYIYLTGNRLTTLAEKVFRAVYQQSLFEFKVEGNSVACDCSISWMVFSTQKVRVEGKCDNPPKLKDRELSSLKEEEFNYCKNTLLAHME